MIKITKFLFSLLLPVTIFIDSLCFAKVVKPITPLQYYYMKNYYNPFWYGGPLNGGDTFDGPFGGFAPNPFARPTAPPKSKNSKPTMTSDIEATESSLKS